MKLPKLNFAPLGKDCVRILAQWSNENQQDLGLVCSVNQVNEEIGYTGFTSHSLVAFVTEVKVALNSPQNFVVCRDHLGKTEDDERVLEILHGDVDAGFEITHLHCEDLELIAKCFESAPRMNFELGTGEAEAKQYASQKILMKDLMSYGYDPDRIAYLTFPTGCLIDEVYNKNNVNQQLCTTMRRFGFDLKGHNSDYATDATLEILSNYLQAINIAPQIGVLMTRTYVDVARVIGYNLKDWENEVYECGEWKRWGSERYALELGGHYHFTSLPEDFTSRAYSAVKETLFFALDYFNEYFRPKG